MNTTEMVGAILIALILGGTLAYIFWRENRKAKLSGPQASRHDAPVNALHLQLQAYERLILLTERIALPNLISRVNQPGMRSRDMQMLLIQTIKQEYEHNITQQLYVSNESWDAVRSLKDQNIHIINQVATILPDQATGSDLNKHLLELILENPKASLHSVVADALSFEAKKLMR